MRNLKIKEAIAAVTQKQKECNQELLKRYPLLFVIALFFIFPAYRRQVFCRMGHSCKQLGQVCNTYDVFALGDHGYLCRK